jgi:hypothetical protein
MAALISGASWKLKMNENIIYIYDISCCVGMGNSWSMCRISFSETFASTLLPPQFQFSLSGVTLVYCISMFLLMLLPSCQLQLHSHTQTKPPPCPLLLLFMLQSAFFRGQNPGGGGGGGKKYKNRELLWNQGGFLNNHKRRLRYIKSGRYLTLFWTFIH